MVPLPPVVMTNSTFRYCQIFLPNPSLTTSMLDWKGILSHLLQSQHWVLPCISSWELWHWVQRNTLGFGWFFISFKQMCSLATSIYIYIYTHTVDSVTMREGSCVVVPWEYFRVLRVVCWVWVLVCVLRLGPAQSPTEEKEVSWITNGIFNKYP